MVIGSVINDKHVNGCGTNCAGNRTVDRLNRLFPLANVLFLTFSVACASNVATSDSTSAQAGRGGGAAAAVPVQTAKVVVKPVPIVLGAVGTAEAVSAVDIRSQVTGPLLEIHFAEGQDVRKGQLLFVLDPRPFQDAIRQAEGVLERDTAQAKNATAQRARTEALFGQGLISRQDYDTQIAAAGALEATLTSDRAQVDEAKLNLQYSRITAPMDGRTGSLMVHPGDLIRANDTTPLITINQVAPIYVTFSVPGRYLVDIRRYATLNPLIATATAQSALPSGSQPPPPAANPAPVGGAEGKVTFIDNAVDPTTGTIKLKALFPNDDRGLWPGLFTQISLQLSSEPNAIVVPAIAVQLSQQGQYVYVVKADHTAEMRPVTVERQQGDDTVIARGLSAGEQVVTDGQLRLSPGARVTTAPTPPQAPAKSS
jgi:multidrug efflux system membrane fusion protein